MQYNSANQAAVILDVDGTLIDSNKAHASAWVNAARDLGITANLKQVLPLIGMGADRIVPILTDCKSDSALGRVLKNRRAAIFRERYLGTLKPQPGSRALIKKFLSMGIKLCVGSSATQEDLNDLLVIVGIKELVTDRITQSDVAASKPDEATVIAALEKLKTSPKQTLMLGDTPYDIEAAMRAGVRTVAFRCGGWSDVGLAGALAIYSNPEDLMRHIDDSPFSRLVCDNKVFPLVQ